MLLITPGISWAQLVQTELTGASETAGRPGGYFTPLSVVVGPKATITTRDNADMSLMDLSRGAVVKVDYTVQNDVAVATNVDVLWHAGE